MARSDITRREPRREEIVQDDSFYETMPMAAAPMARRETVVMTDREDRHVNGALLLLERIVNFIVGVVEALLALRLILAAFSYFGVITTASGFARFIYSITDPLIAPFSSLFNTSYTDPGIWAIAFAMLVYGLIGYAIVRLLQMGQPRDY